MPPPARHESNPRPLDSAQYSRCPGLDGLEVMRACWVEHSFAPHMHDFYALSLNCGGRGAFHCRGDLHEAAPGSCNLIAPGELHTGRAASAEGWRYQNLYIEVPQMASLLEGLDWQRSPELRFKSPLVEDPVLSARLARVFEGLTQSASLLERESLLLTVLARLTAEHVTAAKVPGEARRESPAVRRARDCLEACCEENVSLPFLAQVAGLSPYHLVRAFHREVGIPPHRYQTVVRVHRARKLLAAGEAIAEVVYRTGFCDQSHLNRCFKKTLGVTPGRYARKPNC